MLKDRIDLYKHSQVEKITKNKMCINEAMNVVYHLNEYEPFDEKSWPLALQRGRLFRQITNIATIITMQHWHKLSVHWFVSQVLLDNQHNSLIYICTFIFCQWVIFPPVIASMHIHCRLWTWKIHHVQHVGSKVHPLDASLDPTMLAFPPLWASQNARHPNT